MGCVGSKTNHRKVDVTAFEDGAAVEGTITHFQDSPNKISEGCGVQTVSTELEH